MPVVFYPTVIHGLGFFISYVQGVCNFQVWMKPDCVTIQMKAIKQYFHSLLFIKHYKVILTFKSVDETLVCDHSNDSYWAVLTCSTVYYAVQGGFNF